MKCECCDNEAVYCSAHWLKSGGLIVLYWCEMHALKVAERIEDNKTAPV
jgi:hypothetical protein